MANKKKSNTPAPPVLSPATEGPAEALYRTLHDPMSFTGLEEKIRGEEILMAEEQRKTAEEKEINDLLREKELDKRLADLKDKMGTPAKPQRTLSTRRKK